MIIELDRKDKFLRLYVKNEESIHFYIRSLLPSLEDTREVMQNVAIILWRKFDSISSPEDFRRWAFGVARLEVLEYRRKKAKDRHIFGDNAIELLARTSEDNADKFEDERRILEGCLKELPEQQRSLIDSAYLPEVRIDELALDLGRTPMSLYKTLHRIRMKLRDCARIKSSEAKA